MRPFARFRPKCLKQALSQVKKNGQRSPSPPRPAPTVLPRVAGDVDPQAAEGDRGQAGGQAEV